LAVLFIKNWSENTPKAYPTIIYLNRREFAMNGMLIRLQIPEQGELLKLAVLFIKNWSESATP
jgi:hypothetical protein